MSQTTQHVGVCILYCGSFLYVCNLEVVLAVKLLCMVDTNFKCSLLCDIYLVYKYMSYVLDDLLNSEKYIAIK